ncbi:MAG: hypothetical protein OD918_06350 [Gammaproteobacteria bacterium]
MKLLLRALLTPELRRAMRERAKLIRESAGRALLRARGDLYALRLQAAHAPATFAPVTCA